MQAPAIVEADVGAFAALVDPAATPTRPGAGYPFTEGAIPGGDEVRALFLISVATRLAHRC